MIYARLVHPSGLDLQKNKAAKPTKKKAKTKRSIASLPSLATSSSVSTNFACKNAKIIPDLPGSGLLEPADLMELSVPQPIPVLLLAASCPDLRCFDPSPAYGFNASKEIQTMVCQFIVTLALNLETVGGRRLGLMCRTIIQGVPSLKHITVCRLGPVGCTAWEGIS